MKSRISLFNAAAFRKNLTRFAPAWVLYTVGLFMILLTLLENSSIPLGFASDLGYSIVAMVFCNLCYAFLCAQLLFGDLYSSRMCNALHAMPMRRECWFVTNVISGLSFSVVPTAALALICMAFVGDAWLVPILWLAASVMQYLFFFGTAVLSSYCVGNRFAMAVVYAIINGFSIIVYWLVDTLYAPMLYGIETKMDIFLWLCPFAKMVSDFQYVDVDYTKSGGYILDGPHIRILDGWGYLGVCAALGLVCMLVALLLYRRRNLECAGDFLAVRQLNPVFLVLYTLCGGACCHGFFSLFFGEENLLFLIIGITVGVFTGKMLLQRTVRVFQKSTWLFYGAVVLAFGASLLLTRMDILGITRWVPRAEQVESVSFVTGGTRYIENDCLITDQQQIEDILSVHRHGVENRNEGVNGRSDVKVFLTYKLKSGVTAERNYYIDVDTEAGQLLKQYMSSPEYVLGTADVEKLSNLLVNITTGSDDRIPYEQWRSLMEAIVADCQAGTMAQDWNFYNDQQASWLMLQFARASGEDYYTYRDIRIYEDCVHTMQWLEANGYDEEQFK